MKQNLNLKQDNTVHKYSVKINLGIGHCKMYSYDSEKIKAKLDLTQRNPLGSTDYPIIPTPKIIWLWLNSAVSRLEVCGVGGTVLFLLPQGHSYWKWRHPICSHLSLNPHTME